MAYYLCSGLCIRWVIASLREADYVLQALSNITRTRRTNSLANSAGPFSSTIGWSFDSWKRCLEHESNRFKFEYCVVNLGNLQYPRVIHAPSSGDSCKVISAEWNGEVDRIQYIGSIWESFRRKDWDFIIRRANAMLLFHSMSAESLVKVVKRQKRPITGRFSVKRRIRFEKEFRHIRLKKSPYATQRVLGNHQRLDKPILQIKPRIDQILKGRPKFQFAHTILETRQIIAKITRQVLQSSNREVDVRIVTTRWTNTPTLELNGGRTLPGASEEAQKQFIMNVIQNFDLLTTAFPINNWYRVELRMEKKQRSTISWQSQGCFGKWQKGRSAIFEWYKVDDELFH